MLQLAIPSGNGGHANGQDDGVNDSQVVKEQHPSLAKILGVLPSEVCVKPQQLLLWCGSIFLLALGYVLLLVCFAVRRWFRQAQ